MRIFTLVFLKLVAFMTLVLICNNCEKWNENAVKIERFEYLDESPLLEAYLIQGYKKKYDDSIQRIVDNFICDSILQNNTTYHAKYITFFKETKNTNRENFQTRLKHKIIYAQSRDKLFSYRIRKSDSVRVKIRKIHEVYGTEVSFQEFYCD